MIAREELFADERSRKAIEMIAPGTALREGLSYILQGGTGALLVFGNKRGTSNITEGGISINQPFVPMQLYELSKMDGAILLDKDATKILRANVILQPSTSIISNETGTRHRAAERYAKETGQMVLAVSKRRSSMTLFVGDIKLNLDTVPTLLNKAMQTKATLEKYKESLDKVVFELSVRELEDLVTIFDVVRVVQRAEMVRRMLLEVETYVVELGVEGRPLALQLREYQDSMEEGMLVVRDYFKDGKNWRSGADALAKLESKDVVELGSVAHCLGYSANLASVDDYLVPRGYRILRQTHRLPGAIIENLVNEFGNLRAIMQAPREALIAVEGVGEVRAEKLREGLKLLRNQLIFDLH